MAETPLEYSARILGNVGDRAPLDILSTTPSKVESLIAGRSAEELARRPAPGRWSVAEIVAHLADAEIVGAYRLRMIVATPGISLQAFDQDRFADVFDYGSADLAESLRTYASVRASNLRIWRGASPDRLAAYGVHAERGHESVAHLQRLYAGHDINHLKQIEQICGVR